MNRSGAKFKLILSILFCLISWSFCGWRISILVETNHQNQVMEAAQKPDTRTRVEHPLDGPYQAITHLTLRNNGEAVGYCTGFVIAPKAVLTNRHCLKGADEAAVKIGESDRGLFMLSASMRSTRFQVSEFGQDYGVIFLPEPIPAAHFSLQKFPDHAESADLITAGYPGDKDFHTMWENKYHGFVYLSEEEVFSGGVSYGGQSGSPLFQVKGRKFIAKGILRARSICEGSDACPTGNTYFIPFTDRVLKEIRMWIAMSQ